LASLVENDSSRVFPGSNQDRAVAADNRFVALLPVTIEVRPSFDYKGILDDWWPYAVVGSTQGLLDLWSRSLFRFDR
jgi:hypothetical protein